MQHATVVSSLLSRMHASLCHFALISWQSLKLLAVTFIYSCRGIVPEIEFIKIAGSLYRVMNPPYSIPMVHPFIVHRGRHQALERRKRNDRHRERNPTTNNDRRQNTIDPVLSSSTRDARKIMITDHESSGGKNSAVLLACKAGPAQNDDQQI